MYHSCVSEERSTPHTELNMSYWVGRHRSAFTEPEAELKMPLLLALLICHFFSQVMRALSGESERRNGRKRKGGGQEQKKGLVDTQHTLEWHCDFLLFQKAFQASHRPSRSVRPTMQANGHSEHAQLLLLEKQHTQFSTTRAVTTRNSF